MEYVHACELVLCEGRRIEGQEAQSGKGTALGEETVIGGCKLLYPFPCLPALEQGKDEDDDAEEKDGDSQPHKHVGIRVIRRLDYRVIASCELRSAFCAIAKRRRTHDGDEDAGYRKHNCRGDEGASLRCTASAISSGHRTPFIRASVFYDSFVASAYSLNRCATIFSSSPLKSTP